jgi:DNA-binding TFAR19-related protein (PDSD5 family)
MKMQSSGMLRHVALVRTDVSEEPSTYIIKVTKISELETTIAMTSIQRILQRNTRLSMEALDSPKMSVLTRATWHNIPEDTILQK